MATEHPPSGLRVCAIAAADGRFRAEIVPALGGVVSSLQLPGPDGRPRECLYRHAWFWDPHTDATRGGSPVLFPVCGRLLKDGQPGRYETGGRPYVLPLHGFAMRRPWKVSDDSIPDALELRLADTAETRAMYPFPFELTLRHKPHIKRQNIADQVNRSAAKAMEVKSVQTGQGVSPEELL